MQMSPEIAISYESSNVSLPEEFSKRMKKFAKKKSLKFNALIKLALESYVDDEDCFVNLTNRFAGAKATNQAIEAVEKNEIVQNELLEHLLRQTSSVLAQLKEGQSWEEIRCVLPATEKLEDEQLKEDIAQIKAEIKRDAKIRKETG